jgi:hypothetical protein
MQGCVAWIGGEIERVAAAQTIGYTPHQVMFPNEKPDGITCCQSNFDSEKL